MDSSRSRRLGSIIGLSACLVVFGVAAAAANSHWSKPVTVIAHAGLTNPNAPLGPAGQKYTPTQAQAAIPANRLVLPQTALTGNDSIEGIWATSGQDAETWIQYSTGIVVTEAVPPWDQSTARPRSSSAPTDVASFGRAMLNDGSGMQGEVTQINGVDAFIAYATDPSHAEGPGSILVEVNGSVDSVIGTTSAVTMDDLYTITKALIEAGEAAGQEN
jgi:hypothetical protein